MALSRPALPPTRALGDHSEPDRCPGALRPFAAADGLIARIRLAGRPLTAAQARGIGALAGEQGDGQVHLTTRANVQVRGLDDAGAAAFADGAADLGLLPSPTHERARNIVVSPFAGDLLLGLARHLDEMICATPVLAGLSGRFLVGIDDGDGHVLALPLDIALQHRHGRVRLALGTDPRGYDLGPLHATTLDGIARVVVGIAVDLLDLAGAEQVWNVDDLSLDAADELHARVEGRLPAAPSLLVRREQPELLGARIGDDGRSWIAATAPLGIATGPGWAALADIAEQARGEIRVTPWHAVVVEGVPADAVDTALARLDATGWAVSPGSAWAHVDGCTGTPGCARSRSDVHAHARALAAQGPYETPVMVAGCERRCGHPPVPHLSAVATGPGEYVVSPADGTHRAPGEPLATATPADLADVLRAAAPALDPTSGEQAQP